MGSEIDFEHIYKYNHESQVGLTMNISKTCYSKGDWVNGNLYLKTKPYMQEGILFNPIAYIIITEFHHGEKSKSNNEYYEIKEAPGKNTSEEEKNVLMYPLDLSAYNGVNLFQGINIPFQVKIPDNCYPSYIFDSDTYVRHFLTIDFTSIKAKKSEVIIIKNDQYFSLENKLFKTPIECSKEILKKGMLSKWLFNMTIKLPKNTFKYDENVPFIVEIDCSKLTVNIKSIKVSINIKQKIFSKDKKKETKPEIIKEIVSKVFPLKKGDKNYTIDDIIQLPETLNNPKQVYKKLDSSKGNFAEKFKNIVLFQSCYNGIITCEYNIRVNLEMDSYFSLDDFLEIPLDFYEPNLNNQEEEINLPSLEEISKSKIVMQDNLNNGMNTGMMPIDNNNNQYYNSIDNNNSNHDNTPNYYQNQVQFDNGMNINSYGENITNNIENSDAPPTIGQIMNNDINK